MISLLYEVCNQSYLYIGFPFFSRPVLAWYYLVGIGLLNALGYIIFRASETQRCEFAKDPSSAKPEGKFRLLGSLENGLFPKKKLRRFLKIT